MVIAGPGGAGKGTVVAQLVSDDPDLRLSRSWTTRARRPHEPESAYVFVDRERFLAHVDAGGFMEWAENFGNLYGTPRPEVDDDHDVILEIDVQGAAQVRAAHPEALVILLVPPTAEVQAARLRSRGDDEAHIAARLALSEHEQEVGRRMADAVVVNEDLGRAVAEVRRILIDRRGAVGATSPSGPTPPRPKGA